MTVTGNELYRYGDKAGAESAYRTAIASDPTHAEAHYNLGNLLDARGDKAGAEAAYHNAHEAATTTEEKQFAQAALDKVQAEQASSLVPPEKLVGKRIEIDGKGTGVVQGPFKKGRVFGLGASKHVVRYDNGPTEKLLLRRHGNGGVGFVLADGLGLDNHSAPPFI
uniref:Uncharacterized protein n=1 Tax=viral metagenome TaxID=1070528 RepID=A0A6C0BXT2_9ZZZZ